LGKDPNTAESVEVEYQVPVEFTAERIEDQPIRRLGMKII